MQVKNIMTTDCSEQQKPTQTAQLYKYTVCVYMYICASVTFRVSISCSVLHTRSIRYSHKSQNDWKDSVRLLRPVLVVFDKKEIASANKVRNQQQLHPYSAMVNASPERESGYWHTARLPSKSGQNEQRSFHKVVVWYPKWNDAAGYALAW